MMEHLVPVFHAIPIPIDGSSKTISLLAVAHRCYVLRSEWCQHPHRVVDTCRALRGRTREASSPTSAPAISGTRAPLYFF
jgi:hypothetical protein